MLRLGHCRYGLRGGNDTTAPHALVFGYAYQLLTGLIDRQAMGLLSSVPSEDAQQGRPQLSVRDPGEPGGHDVTSAQLAHGSVEGARIKRLRESRLSFAIPDEPVFITRLQKPLGINFRGPDQAGTRPRRSATDHGFSEGDMATEPGSPGRLSALSDTAAGHAPAFRWRLPSEVFPPLRAGPHVSREPAAPSCEVPALAG